MSEEVLMFEGREFFQIINVEEDVGKYMISKCGKILSLSTMRLMKIQIKTTGYEQISFRIPGRKHSKKYLIHRLLALTFIPNPENKPQINHIDGNKLNNVLSNLEWVTNLENNAHAIKTGLFDMKKCNLLSDDEVHEVCKHFISGEYSSLEELAIKLGISERASRYTLGAIRNGKSYTYISSLYGVENFVKGRLISKANKNRQRGILTDSQVREICEIFVSGEYTTLKKLSEDLKLGVSPKLLSSIRNGVHYSHITAEYGVENFINNRYANNHNRIFEKDTVILIRKLISEGKSDREICNHLGLEKVTSAINLIRNGKTYKNVK